MLIMYLNTSLKNYKFSNTVPNTLDMGINKWQVRFCVHLSLNSNKGKNQTILLCHLAIDYIFFQSEMKPLITPLCGK